MNEACSCTVGTTVRDRVLGAFSIVTGSHAIVHNLVWQEVLFSFPLMRKGDLNDDKSLKVMGIGGNPRSRS